MELRKRSLVETVDGGHNTTDVALGDDLTTVDGINAINTPVALTYVIPGVNS